RIWIIGGGGNKDEFQAGIYNGADYTTQSIIGTTKTAEQTWYHVALVDNGSVSKLYVNGNQEGSNLSYSITDLSQNVMYIGTDERRLYMPLNGLIDDVLIFKRDLTDQEIKALYNASANKYYRNFTNLPNGNYNFRAYAVDIYDKINKTEERNVTIDFQVAVNCGNLNIPNTIYNLTQNVSSTGTCFNVTANNVTLNCNGYEINYSSDGGNYEYGIYSNQNFTTIKNCRIKEGLTGGDYDYAIYFNGTKNGTINNNTITTSGSRGYGILLYSSSNSNTLSSNNITTSGSSGFGIRLDSSSNFNTLSNNIITTSYTNGWGIYLSSSSANTLSNNTITTSGITGYGIYLSSSSANTLSNNTITTSGSNGFGIWLQSSSNNNSFSGMNIKTNNAAGYGIYIADTNHNFTISDSVLNSSYAGVQELYVRSIVTGGEWNFTNVTRANGSPITINWEAGGNGTLNMKWYLDVNVTNSTGALQDANVTAWNKNNISQFSANTTATGFIPRQTLLEYTNINNTLKTYFSNYTINVTKAGYQTYSNKSVNMSANRRLDVVLGVGAGTDVSQCGVLDNANTVYNLTGNIINNTLTWPCINITAQNITFDCRGFSITSDDAVTGVYSDQLNTTIKNCNISMGSAVAGRGIFLYGANDSYIYNNYLHDQYAGLFSQSFSVRVLNNTLVGHSFGMEFNNVNGIGNNTIANNTVNGGSYGIQLFQTFNNLVTGNKITSVTGSGGGIVIGTNAKDNYLINNVVVNNNIGVSLSNSFNNIFADSNFSQNTQNVYLESTSTNNTFLNCSYDNSGTKESVSAGSQLIRKWYYQANVTDGINPIINANLSAYNVSGNWQFNLTSNSSGLTNRTTITEYVNDGTRNYYSLYTINTLNGSLSESHKLNVTEKTLQTGFGGLILDNIIFDIIPPSINFVLPTPLNGSTPLGNNIFVNVSASDVGRGNNNISTFIDFDNSLVGWWRMDDLNSSGGVIDYTGKNNGTAKGNAVQTDAGKFGKGFSFDGVSGSCINIGEPSSLDVNFTRLTLSAWFKREEGGTFLLGKFSIWSIGPFSDTVLRFRHLNVGDEFTDLIVPSLGTSWHHMAATFNGTNTNMYLDGVYIGGEVALGSLGINNDGVGIGANDGGCNNARFNGTLDDVMIFNRSLSAEEIRGLYANTSSRYLGVNFTNLTERNYTFKAYAQDTFGNVNSTEKREVNVNFGPKIIWVQNLGNVMGFAGGIRNITINFTVFDFNGFADLNDSSANANFTKEGVVRNKINCSKIVGWDKYANYSCIIGMWYYDKGGNWNINISIADKKGNWGINNSNSFYYEYLYSFDMVPNYVNWSNMEIGMTNKSADNNMTIRNRGNVNIINATINATNLNGTVNPSQFIPAANFTFSNSSFNSCSGSRLIKNQNVSVALFINYSKSINYNYANNTLSFCLKGLPAGISAQEYKTETGKDWDINVIFGFFISMKYALLAVAVVIKKRKSRKKRYLLNQEELLSLDEKLKEKYKTNIRELLGAVEKDRIKKEIQVPADIFKGKISPAEALCKYLRENIRLRFSEIARLLERDERTIWINYRNAAKKMKEKIRAGKKLSTPIDIFSNRKLSILESVVNYLKEKGFRNYEIAELLGKDQRNIYTLYNRAKKKLR
ncbi:MAG: LamG-like jellyroll fold domain-containing protein, partial [Nanoarchaeota archaeon]|nr:LamG-like jellyroll fold domain-containing protein [Nanoarchaeota archaeon]